MTLSVVRSTLRAAVDAALNDDSWLGTETIPLTPDDPAFWVRFPNDARRATLSGGLEYQINVTFACGLFDTDMAQEALNEIYDPELWAAIESYATDVWQGISVVRLDEPYQLTIDDTRKMLAVDMPIDIYT